MYYFNSLEIFDYNSQYYKQYSYNFKLTNVINKNAILLYNQNNNISCYMGQLDLWINDIQVYSSHIRPLGTRG